MRLFGAKIARLFVTLRYVVVLAWIGVTIWMTIALPPISGASTNSFSALVPSHAPAITAQQVSARYFAFPVIARTMIVVRNPRGLPAHRQTQLLSLAVRLSRHQLPEFSGIAGAIPLLNTLGAPPFSRQPGTTAVLYLFFHPGLSSSAETALAERLITQQLGHRPGEYAGVTGAVPAEGAQTRLINNRLIWVELATILLVAFAIAVHFRAFGAAALAIGAVAISYLVAVRVVSEFARLAGLSVPAEAQPVLVVLVFGVVTDYSIFFLSRFRALLALGVERREATAQVMREIAPIVSVAGLTVAVGTAGLVAASMSYLRAFGPGLAIAVLIAMIVAVTFVPAALAIGGRATFWPSGLVAGAGHAAAAAKRWRNRRTVTVRLAVRHPAVAALIVLALVGGAASGLSRIAVGNALVTGLPGSSEIHRSYDVARRGFAPGVLDPALVLITGTAVGHERAGLARLERLIARQPDVAQVIGPGQRPYQRRFGAFIASSGTAARYVVVLASDPLGPRAIAAVEHLRSAMPKLMARARLPRAHAAVGGDTAVSADIVSGTMTSLERVLPALLGLVFLVIALYLRALVASAYLLLTSMLAALAALGLTVYALQMFLGYRQVTYYVVFTVIVLLVSLGSDYNVFVVGRIWQEARRRPLRDAIELAGSRAARPVTTAGFVLASSFVLLAIVPLRAFREIAFAMAVGLLIDTLLIRTILVPALLSLVGQRSGWPGHALKVTPATAPQAPSEQPPARRAA